MSRKERHAHHHLRELEGRLRSYDIVKDIIALAGQAGPSALLFSSPNEKPSTVRGWSRGPEWTLSPRQAEPLQ